MDSYKITVNAFDMQAQAYQDKFMDLDLYDDTYNVFCDLITPPNAEIFEIGCGPGNITKYLLSKNPNYRITAIDLAPNMIKLAKENNPTANCMVMDSRSIDTITQKFDAIICGFCMPYLSKTDCEKMFADCALLLNANGIFYFSLIEGNYSKSGYETNSKGEHPSYVYYHEENYLVQYLNDNAMEVVHTNRKYYTKHDGVVSTHLIIIAKKQ